MHHIIVENLVKTFRVAERAAGLWDAIRGVVTESIGPCVHSMACLLLSTLES